MNILEKRNKQANDFAMSLDKIKEDCPRDIVNPGLYFGYLKGYSDACNDLIEAFPDLEQKIKELVIDNV